MSQLENLGRILTAEQKSGYTNSVVIGGLEPFVGKWVREFTTQDPSQLELASKIAASLEGYTASAPDVRKEMIARAIALVAGKPGGRSANSSKQQEPTPSTPRGKRNSPSSSRTPHSEALSLVGRAETLPRPPEGAPPPEDEDEGEEVLTLSRRDAGFGLDAMVNRLQGVGPQRAKQLAKLGVDTIKDLLFLYPRRYDDYSHLKTIAELMYGDETTILARVGAVNTVEVRGRRTITNVLLVDPTGVINATFFNQKFLAKSLRPGLQIVVHGLVDRYMNRVSFSHPEWERLGKGVVGIQPVYPLTEGLTARWIRQLVRGVVGYWADKVADPLPADLRARAGLVDLTTALREIHFPTSWESIDPARKRLAFEELLLLQMIVLTQRYRWQSQPGLAFHIQPGFGSKTFPEMLPFELTGAQQRVIGEILSDMAKPEPMHRLVQGDVGSGKTVVALAAMLAAVQDGRQAAFMAPTEILAEQHHKGIMGILGREGLPVPGPRVGLLTGSLRPGEKQRIQGEIASGELDIIIGTHALIQEGVRFQNLGLAVVDEQHRFGVNQRRMLQDRTGHPRVAPDILVMSATPIPRTLALTVFGDLDVSIIDEMPRGRRPIRTKWLEPRERERAYEFIRKQVAEGRQAFVICPLIEESEAIDAQAAVEEYQRLRADVYPDLRVGLIHGKLRPAEKDAVMAAFSGGQIDVLVATSVVEVGIDVPNASVMLIEGADRFGLAQLHQFRGRIGRGAHQSFCMLLADKSGSTSDERLKVIEETQDGFRLAEEDLKLRGPGEFFGTRQSGLPDLRIAKLSDVRLLESARAFAQEIFRQDPELRSTEYQPLRKKMKEFWKGEGDLS